LARILSRSLRVVERTQSPSLGSLPAPETPALAANAMQTRKGGLRARLLRIAAAPHVLALADQAVVSGASFLTTIIIGRSNLPTQLGIYSVGISLLAWSLAIQDSLILLPYTIQRHRPLGTPAEHVGSSLIQNGLLSALAMIILAATALGLSAQSAAPELVATVWVLVAVAPFALLREFGRTLALAHLRLGQTLMLDLTVAAIQLAGLGWLVWTGRLSSATACAALGGACALTVIAWLYLARGNFAIRADQVWETMKQSWGLGKWLFVGQMAVSAQGSALYWLLPLLVGLPATGVYAACMSVASLANPLITAFRNILTPRAVLAFRKGGVANLRRQAIRDSLLLDAAMTLFCLMIMLVGEDAMRLLYRDKVYEGYGHVTTLLALALLAGAAGATASNALASMERPREIVWATSVGAVVTGVLVWVLAVKWGLLGVAYGVLAGNVAGSAARWIAFLALAKRTDQKPVTLRMCSDSNSAKVMQALQQFTRSPIDNSWIIEQLDEGAEAIVYAVRSPNGQPIWQTYRTLVIKMYRTAAAPNVGLVRRQFEAYSRLHAALAGCAIKGWKTSTPVPLYVCESPLALVMTMVPGRTLKHCLETGDNVTLEVLGAVSHALVATMARYWSIESQLYGELSFNNILCDIATRDLSFVDLGVPENGVFCDNATKRWYPASHDLGYMLYDTGVTVRSNFGHPGARLRKEMFVENVLRVFVETIGPFEDKQRLLDEIQACARAHLKRLDHSWSARGLWRFLLKQIASRRVEAILGKVKAELESLGGTT
jgi:O-antigen/teichoic acid export membrane protein